ncbi:5-formyltetrahydrofolate cyclo-ligase [Acinetobacter bouvetii DSM 14964 = CIP 107468]|uniref:5-formyltetrahydrofolate cyclo-ligase n=1 Tax=Acinetobacter bouvetii DSM 14964 = CIP 107468 TaxID=1120925 RepID=N9DLN0_9GAMM|nr:5-formyltetrahydrofolate cyclo-ligase [Acinetobacter bouvetii]ENV83614.1 5-formyltetrahydrofolate cyclo-ligase [Acinetobacter bouvetii DSM 14964 = CIP 107468]BCU65450.1 5-formyltetrahydrofolate cyclo-ligase [Acinetobacter bouvetii]
MSYDLNTLRKDLRQQRRAVSKFQQRQSEQAVLNRIIRLPEFQQAKKIGIYLHAFGEIHTRKIMQYCFAQGKAVYLPMICNMNQRLSWVHISQHQYFSQRFSHHPLGMKEPMSSRGLHVSKLDLLIMPLLACDAHGTRIGMGGGYYDKTLASAPQHPFRLSLAHHFQLISETLPRESWDQPLDALLTPQALLRFPR